MTSLHGSRALTLCREAGAQGSAWPGDFELLDTAYDFGVMRNLCASHTGDDVSSAGLAQCGQIHK